MKKRVLSFLLALILIMAFFPAAALAAAPSVHTDKSSYTAGDTVNVLLSSDTDLMIEVFSGTPSSGTKLISSATSGKAYSFQTDTGWSAGNYTVVVGAGSNTASCTFSLTASGGSKETKYVSLTVYGPSSVLLSKQFEYTGGMTAYSLLKDFSGLSVSASKSGAYGTSYVSAISGYAEFDYGSASGWLYSVNGTQPNVGASAYTLSAGDSVLWFYTKDGISAMYSSASSSDTGGKQPVFSADNRGMASIDASKLPDILKAGNGLAVKADAGTISMTADGASFLANKLGSSGTIAVGVSKSDSGKYTVVSNSKTIASLDISLTVGNTKIISGFGTITVSVNVGKSYSGSSLNILHLKEDGSSEILNGNVNSDGVLSFDTASLSTFVVMSASDIPVEYRFTDVKAGEWYVGYLQYAYGKGLLTGTSDTVFAPNMPMTRAMLVTVLYRMDGAKSKGFTGSYSDVKNGEWYSDAVSWAAQNGIVSGYGDGIFGTGDSVTREQAAKIFLSFAKYKGCDVSKTGNLTDFTDSGSVSGWASSAVSWAVTSGLMNGTSAKTLSPSGEITRAQAAALLTRFSVK